MIRANCAIKIGASIRANRVANRPFLENTSEFPEMITSVIALSFL